MKEILLSKHGKNKGKYVALVNDEDFELLNSFKWWANKHRDTYYAARKVYVGRSQTTIYMQWDVLNGKSIDHVDGNGLNNQRYNLRFCTKSQNQMNNRKQIRKQNNASSIYKGASFHKQTGKWIARIKINGNSIYIGLFPSEIEAAKAYDKKAIELFGEFAHLNNA